MMSAFRGYPPGASIAGTGGSSLSESRGAGRWPAAAAGVGADVH
jgi:hypothetical protein